MKVFFVRLQKKSVNLLRYASLHNMKSNLGIAVKLQIFTASIAFIMLCISLIDHLHTKPEVTKTKGLHEDSVLTNKTVLSETHFKKDTVVVEKIVYIQLDLTKTKNLLLPKKKKNISIKPNTHLAFKRPKPTDDRYGLSKLPALPKGSAIRITPENAYLAYGLNEVKSVSTIH